MKNKIALLRPFIYQASVISVSCKKEAKAGLVK
jgi:hypothetical protein